MSSRQLHPLTTGFSAKRVLLIFLMLLLPLHMTLASERVFLHTLDNNSDQESSLAHFLEHAEHDSLSTAKAKFDHDGDEQSQSEHLIDHEQVCGINLILSPNIVLPFYSGSVELPAFFAGIIVTRTISPPLRPPRLKN